MYNKFQRITIILLYFCTYHSFKKKRKTSRNSCKILPYAIDFGVSPTTALMSCVKKVERGKKFQFSRQTATNFDRGDTWVLKTSIMLLNFP